jgi:peptide/nickel transport system substrate-binding protein
MNRARKYRNWVCLSFLLCLLPSLALVAVAASRDAEIVIAAPRDITPGRTFFHPTSVICYTWEPLVGVDDGWNPAPVLATSWTMSADGKAWVFQLRRGVKFHDGTAFNADAVLANFDRYRKTPGKNRFYTFRMNRYYPFFESIEKVDDFAVRLRFSKPMATLPYYMANWGSAMHSPRSFNEKGEFITRPASTGPFKVIEHKMDQYAVLESFGDYWGPKAKAKRVRIKVIPDVNTRFSALRSEEIQSVMDLGAITPTLAKELLKDERFALSKSRNSILHFLGVNGTRFPFSDGRMRRALSLIIDRRMLAEAFFHGYFEPTINILNYASPFYKQMAISHDPELARRLAAEVLAGKSATVEILLSSGPQNYPYKEISVYLQSVMAELGITATIRMVEKGAFRPTLKNGAYDVYVRRQGLPNGEALGIFNDYMRLEGTQGMNPSTQNKTYHYGYSNAAVEQMLDKAQATLELAERKRIYHELQEIAAQELPVIPLLNERTLVVYNKAISGFEAMIYGATLPNAHWVK